MPIRLSYHRLVHYNSIVDPHKATIGVGLGTFGKCFVFHFMYHDNFVISPKGLPGHNPGAADRNLIGQAVKASEETLVEQVMLEDKLKTTGMTCWSCQAFSTKRYCLRSA